MPAFFRHRFRFKGGHVVVDLPEDEQEMLAHVLPQLRELVMGETDPALRRLSPPARLDDHEAETFYRQMVTDELLRSRLEAIEVVESGIDGTTLDDAGVDAWMHSLNALRLVLGERLEVAVVGHDALHNLPDDDERVPIVALYEWLGWLLEQLVDAAMNGLTDSED